MAQRRKTVAFFRSQVQQAHLALNEQLAAVSMRARARGESDGDWLWAYVHCVCIEDIAVNILVQARAPVFQDCWAGGHVRPQDVASARAYADAVHAATDRFVAHLVPAELERTIDLPALRLSWPTVGWALNRFVLWQTAMTCGEMAAGQRRPGSRASIGPSTPPIAPPVPLPGRADGQDRAPSDAHRAGAHAGTPTVLLNAERRRPADRIVRQRSP